MEAGLREVCRSVRIGKILIQRVRSRSYVAHDRWPNYRLNRTRRRPFQSCFIPRSHQRLPYPFGLDFNSERSCSFPKTLPRAMFFFSIPCSVRITYTLIYDHLAHMMYNALCEQRQEVRQ